MVGYWFIFYTLAIVREDEGYNVYWDRTLTADKQIQWNRSDVTLFDITNMLVPIGNTDIVHNNKMQEYVKLACEIKEQTTYETGDSSTSSPEKRHLQHHPKGSSAWHTPYCGQIYVFNNNCWQYF